MAKATTATISNGTKKALKSLETSADKAFYMANGRVITKLSDLPGAVESTDDNTFYYHVNSEKNDFANWIKDVFNITPLANKIKSKKNKDELVKILRSEIK